MTTTPLALALPDTAAQASANYEYTASEKATINQYQAALSEGGYYKIFDASSAYPRLISKDDPLKLLPLSFLPSDFNDWCKETSNKRPLKAPSEIYLAQPLLSVTGTIFKPNGEALVRAKQSRHRYINTYKEYQPERDPLELSPIFVEFMSSLFPDKSERHIFTQYISHTLRYPQVRPSWHVMLLSETGTGKGFLFGDILTPLLCKQTSLVRKYSDILGKFSTIMEESLIVLLDDCKTNRESTQTELKSLMTEERVYTERKGSQGSMVSTYTRMILASNEDAPLFLNDSERRWWVPKRLGYSHELIGKEGRDDRKALVQRLSDWLKLDGALESVHQHLIEYDLTGFDPKCAPECDTLNEIIAKSETVEQTFAHDFLHNHPAKVVKSAELQKAFTDAGMNKPGNNSIRYLFEYCKYRQDTLTINGSRTRFWFPSSMSNKEAAAILETPATF